MATLLPPPKRKKLYHGVPEPEPEPPKQVPNVVVQFVSEDDGKPLAAAVNIPADVSREALEALVNKLNTKVLFRPLLDSDFRIQTDDDLGRRTCTVFVSR